MSRKTRTLVPVSTNLLYLEVVSEVPNCIKLKSQKAKGYFDKKAWLLPELELATRKVSYEAVRYAVS